MKVNCGNWNVPKVCHSEAVCFEAVKSENGYKRHPVQLRFTKFSLFMLKVWLVLAVSTVSKQIF